MTDDDPKSRTQLIVELEKARRRDGELEASETALKMAETAIRISEEQFKTLVEHASAGIFIYDIEQERITRANDQIMSLLGYPREDFLNSDWKKISASSQVGDQSALKWGKTLEQQALNGESVTVEWNFLSFEREKIPVILHLNRLPPEERSLILGSLTDISEIKKSEQKYQDLYDNAPDMFVSADIDTEKIVRCNQTLCEKLGYDKKECIGKKFFSLFHSDCMEDAKNVFKAFTDTGKIYDAELQLKKKDGGKIHVSLNISAVRDNNGNITRSRSIFRDITRRVQVEKVLKESENHYRQLYHSLPVPYQSIDLDGILLDVNKAWLNELGYSPAEVTGKWFGDFVHPDFIEHFKTQFSLFKKKGEIQDLEFDLIKKDGTPISVLFMGRTVTDEKKRFRRTHCIFTNITYRKEIEKELKNSLTEKEILLNEIHNRVKNNLQVIISLLNLQAHNIEDEKMRAAFKEIRSRIYTMSLVHEKLYESRAFTEIDAKEYVETITSELVNSYKTEKNIRLDLNINNTVLEVDKAIPFGLILTELSTNALKHAFKNRENGRISISLQTEQSNLCRFAIEDDGEGLPSHFDIAKTKSFGLQLVRLLTEQLEGSISVKQENGTCFEIVFPV